VIEDFREHGATPELEADVCILGAGAAGISIARELAGAPARVIVLESGGREFEPEVQALYAGRNVGLPYFDLATTRLRYLGGTTNHWSGRCAPLDPIDFRARSWMPLSGWPLAAGELDPYYARACAVIGLGEPIFDDRLFRRLGLDPIPFDPTKQVVRWWRFHAQRFGPKFEPELAAAKNVRLLLHATALSIDANPEATRIERVRFGSLDGKRGAVRARHYVLACGGLENPRLLLASNGVEAKGLGNRHDLVGRHFMEHPHADTCVATLEDPAPFLRALRRQDDGDNEFTPSLCPGEALQEREQIGNGSLAVYFESAEDSGLVAAQAIGASVQKGELPDELGTKLLAIAGDLDDAAVAAWEHFVHGRPFVLTPGKVYFGMRGEQEPNPASRVSLIEEKDAFGMPRIALDWRMTPLDKRSALVHTRALGEELGRLGLGRLQIDEWLRDGTADWPLDQLAGGHHHMGTTRMAADPARGVVDASCRVHGLANLYVAGSSVFATSGWANPTLTIVALALRLADHLRASVD
jgi:choline dehydrogenase-like flavoprotein